MSVSSAKKLMTRKLITVSTEDSVDKAHTLMSAKRIRHLPVLDEAGRIMGILSDRDVRRAMIPSPNSLPVEEATISFPEGASVKEFMSWPVQTVEENDEADEIAAAFLNTKVSAFLVTDARGQLKGIVTTDDLLRYLIELCRDGSVWQTQTEQPEFWASIRQRWAF